MPRKQENLHSTHDTSENRKLIAKLLKAKPITKNPVIVFEHGHFWVKDKYTDDLWDVVDTNMGFDFERVS